MLGTSFEGSVRHTTIADNRGSGQGVLMSGYMTLAFNNNLLQAGSAAIDNGDPDSGLSPPETDLDGNPRVVDGDLDGTAVVDIGAYEFQTETRFLSLITKNWEGVEP
jgi:hypothetical protein